MPPIPASAPRSIPDECTQEVVDIIETCLDPNPHARPTAVQLAQMLQRAPTGLAGGDAGSSAANSMQLPPPPTLGGPAALGFSTDSFGYAGGGGRHGGGGGGSDTRGAGWEPGDAQVAPSGLAQRAP